MVLTRLSSTGGPVLFWRGPDFDSLDLTGPVLGNWVHKGVGLFSDYGLGPDFTLSVPSPAGLHWRELVAILSVLLGGGRVVLGAPRAPEEEFHAFVPVGSESDPQLDSAEEVFVYNPPALALSTPVAADFIDVNSAIRAYPDVTPRRLERSGILAVAGPGDAEPAVIDWAGAEAGAGRPAGILVSRSTPLPHQWPDFLGHLLAGGETVLGTGMEEDRITDLAVGLGELRGRLGTWTK